MSIDPIDTLPKMLTRRTEPPHERALQPPPRPTAPYLLIGLVSALIGRRDALRCTWLRALRSGPHAGAARVLFVVGNGAEDAGRPDVLSTAVEEQRQSKQTGSRRVRGTVATYSTYSLYAKTMHFVRYASTQLEPAIALADPTPPSPASGLLTDPGLSPQLKILALLTLLSVLPAIVLTMTSFTRVIIVLGLMLMLSGLSTAAFFWRGEKL
jgi:hypothetical protein